MVKKCVDDFLLFGRVGLISAILIELTMIQECGNLLFMVFAGAEAKIIGCDGFLKANDNTTTSENNLCASFQNNSCESYQTRFEFHSISVEWGLLCHKASSVKDSTSYQMLGFLIGSPFWGRISDSYGRKPSMLICLIGSGVFGLISAFSNNILVFTILRTIVSFFATGTGVVANTFFGELFPSKVRQSMAYILNWSPSLLVITLIAYYCQTWRVLSMVISAITIPAILIMWYIDETPHYLLRSGQSDRAIEVIKRVHKINRKQIDLDELQEAFREEKLNEEQTKKESYSFWHIFSTPRLVAYTIAICFSNFEVGLISYSLLFDLGKISGSMYGNLMIISLSRYGCNLLSALAEYKCKWLGRKTAHKLYCLFTIGALAVWIGAEASEAPKIVSRICLLATAVIIVQVFAVLGIVCTEIFPTPLRNTSYAFSQLIESLGPILAPHLFAIDFGLKWLPRAIMITCVIIDFLFFAAVIPESRGKPLVDKMPENHERFKIFQDRRKIKSCFSHDKA